MDNNVQPPRRRWASLAEVGPKWLFAIAALITALTGAGFFAGRATAPTVQPSSKVTNASPVQSPTTAKSGPHSGAKLFAKNGVQLTDCYALSLTDPSLHPYQVPGCMTTSSDLFIDDYGDVLSDAQLAVYQGKAGFSQCQADTTYVSPGSFANPNHQRLTGSTLCITTANRMAVCYITEDTTSQSVAAPGLNLDVSVYSVK